MQTINELRANLPINVVIDFHIENDPEVIALEKRINAGELSAIEELEITVAWILENEIENFEGKESFSSAFLRGMKMFVRTKQICALED
jgi:hypothetical protein